MFVGILELISYLIRLISFTFRLFGNMLGGEILVLVLFTCSCSEVFGIIPGIYGFEMLIGVIQALIFAGFDAGICLHGGSFSREEEHT